jgi:hypothetical protein
MLRLIVLFRRRTRLSSITVRDSSWSCGIDSESPTTVRVARVALSVGVTLRSRRDIWYGYPKFVLARLPLSELGLAFKFPFKFRFGFTALVRVTVTGWVWGWGWGLGLRPPG